MIDGITTLGAVVGGLMGALQESLPLCPHQGDLSGR